MLLRNTVLKSYIIINGANGHRSYCGFGLAFRLFMIFLAIINNAPPYSGLFPRAPFSEVDSPS